MHHASGALAALLQLVAALLSVLCLCAAACRCHLGLTPAARRCRFCQDHILNDTAQVLYVKCQPSNGRACNNPVPRFQHPPVCEYCVAVDDFTRNPRLMKKPPPRTDLPLDPATMAGLSGGAMAGIAGLSPAARAAVFLQALELTRSLFFAQGTWTLMGSRLLWGATRKCLTLTN